MPQRHYQVFSFFMKFYINPPCITLARHVLSLWILDSVVMSHDPLRFLTYYHFYFIIKNCLNKLFKQKKTPACAGVRTKFIQVFVSLPVVSSQVHRILGLVPSGKDQVLTCETPQPDCQSTSRSQARGSPSTTCHRPSTSTGRRGRHRRRGR